MSAETLAMSVGVILSLVFSFFPKVNTWYKKLTGKIKRILMASLLVLVAAVAYLLSCKGLGTSLGINIVCDEFGALGLLKDILLAVAANQSAYLLTSKPSIEKAAASL